MRFIGGLVGAGGCIVCFALLFVIVMVGLVLWYWRHQPEQQTSLVPPTPPVQASIEHPTAATPAAPGAPAAPPSDATPPSADA